MKYQAMETSAGAVVVYGGLMGYIIECECVDLHTAGKVAQRLNFVAEARAIAAHQREADRRASAVLGRGPRAGVRHFEADKFA